MDIENRVATLEQREKLTNYFSLIEFKRNLPHDIANCHTEGEIKTGSEMAYQNDYLLRGRVNNLVSGVVDIMEAK